MTRKEKDLLLDEVYKEVQNIREKFYDLSSRLFELKRELEELASDVSITATKLIDVKDKIWRSKG